MSTSMIATVRFVYGIADHAVVGRRRRPARPPSAPCGNQAWGFAAATSVIGASRAPDRLAVRGRRRRRAGRGGPMSRTANVSQAWNTSCAISAGMERRLERERPAARDRGTTTPAARPPSSAGASWRAPRPRPRAPRRDRRRGSAQLARRAAAGARCRPMPDMRVCAGAMPSRSAKPPTGIVVGPAHAVHDVDRRRPRRARRPTHRCRPRPRVPSAATSRAARGRDRHRRGARSRWATPMRHGDRGSTAHRSTGPASQSAAASRRTPSGPPWRPRWRRSSDDSSCSMT